MNPLKLVSLALLTLLASNSQAEALVQNVFQGHVQPYQAATNRIAPPPVDFIDSNSEPQSLSSYRGQVLVINFWASWCPTCLSEMAALQRLQQQLGDRAKILTLNQDLDDSRQIEQLLNRLEAGQLPPWRDQNGRLGFAMGQTLLPTTIFIDSQGQIAGQLIGSAEWDSPEALALIDSLQQ